MQQPTPSRLEAFSDGVIAVIITIMVLELKVPHAAGVEGLRSLLPTLGAYLLSFLFVGVYWVNHHYLVDRLKHVNALILWVNLALLFALSLLPFFTSYLIEKHFESFSVVVYAVSLLFSAACFQALSYAISHGVQHAEAEISAADQQEHRLQRGKGWFSFALYCASVGVAFRHPLIALGMLSVVTLIWIVPSFGTAKAQQVADRHHGRSA